MFCAQYHRGNKKGRRAHFHQDLVWWWGDKPCTHNWNTLASGKYHVSDAEEKCGLRDFSVSKHVLSMYKAIGSISNTKIERKKHQRDAIGNREVDNI